jgi:phosphatidate cytidylyltransferase
MRWRHMHPVGGSLGGSSRVSHPNAISEFGRRHRRWDPNLVTRVLIAGIGIPVVLAMNYVGGALYLAVITITALLAAAEAYHILWQGGYRPLALLGLPLAAILAAAPAFHHSSDVWRASVLISLMIAALWFFPRRMSKQPFTNWAFTILPAVYTGGLLGSLLAVRLLHRGAWLVFVILLTTWAYDTGAYIAGHFWGQRPFMQHISPKKTWEGVAGGLILALAAVLVCGPHAGLSRWVTVALALTIAVAAQVGDLAESLLKRQAGVKDSGVLIPGHGGLLDRIDSLLFTSTAGYYLFLAVGYH